MGTAPGAIKLVKAGFVVLDAKAAIQKIVVFQYNPETLVRRLEGVVAGVAASVAPSSGTAASGGVSAGASAPGVKVSSPAAAGVGAAAGAAVAGVTAAGARGAAAAPPVATPSPYETVSFTIALDAADKLQLGDALTQQNGVFPALSALELLLYPAANTLTVWVSGSKRILPVRITQMQIMEQMFDPALNPIRAEVSVALQVLKDADLASNAHGKALWDAHYNVMQQLANAALSGVNLGMMGITGI